MSNTSQLENILKRISPDLPQPNRFWPSFDRLADLDADEKIILYTGCLRRMGRKPANAADEEKDFLATAFKVNLTEYSTGQLARALILLKQNNTDLAEEILLRGDDSEQIALLSIINEVEGSADLCMSVVNLCRTNSVDVFGAVSQNNPYASEHFSDGAFFQMTMKTIFLGLNFDEIAGMDKRYNEELGRMLKDFYDERTAAGRAFPDNVKEFMKNKGVL